MSRSVWKARNWSSGCRATRWTFSASEILLGDAALAHDAGNRLRLRQALLLDQQFQRPVAPAAGRDLEHAGLVALGIDDRPDVQALQQRRWAMSSASSSIETPALTRRTLDWLSTSLLKGMSREGDERDLLNGFRHVGFSTTGGRETLSRPPTRREQRPLLSLSRGREEAKHHAAS